MGRREKVEREREGIEEGVEDSFNRNDGDEWEGGKVKRGGRYS